MEKDNILICLRHLQDVNSLKTHGLDGPLIPGQEKKVKISAKKIQNILHKTKHEGIKLFYTDNSKRVEQTALMLYSELSKKYKVTKNVDKRLNIFDQGRLSLPDNYRDGRYFHPLTKAWDAFCDEAYLFRNLDYRFGCGQGYKKYPILKKYFKEEGENITNLLIRQYDFLIEILSEKKNSNSKHLKIVCGQDMLILLIKELLSLASSKEKFRPEELPFKCWEAYKNKLQGKNNDNTPFGNLVTFDLKKLKEPKFIQKIQLAKEYLEMRKNVPHSSIQGIINNTHNNYEVLNKKFKKITNSSIDSTMPLKKGVKFFPISVIIPYYNSRKTMLHVLKSIELQNLSPAELSQVEVIVVDDGWNDDIKEITSNNNYSFNLKIISYKNNKGRSGARNTGAKNAKHNILLFLDADNILSGECIREHSVRNGIIPDQLYTSLVANIFPKDIKKIAQPYFKKNIPLPKPPYFNEFRTVEVINKKSVGINDITEDTTIEILKETNNFRDYGYGRMIAYYDLPSMYATYCVSVTKRLFNKIGGFSKVFKGWGMEDSYFGAVGITKGAKIIPILSCGSYSINLPSHSGSEKKEKIELQKNIVRYKKLLKNNR